MRKNSIKNTRINGEVQKELSSIIRGEIKDPRIHPMTSVMAVEGRALFAKLREAYLHLAACVLCLRGRTSPRR